MFMIRLDWINNKIKIHVSLLKGDPSGAGLEVSPGGKELVGNHG